MNYKIDGNHVEIYFEDIPSDKIRETLKICSWRWIKNKKCWSNFLSNDNIIWAKSLCEEMNPKRESSLLSKERYTVGMKDVLVRSNGFFCNQQHELEDMAGEIEVGDKSGNIMTYLVPIAYCRSCDIFYILEETYLELKKKKVVLRCQILSYKEYVENSKHEFGELNSVSPLRKWGYTVSQIEGYSERQRQAILEDIIDCGIMSKDKVLSYLDFFIKLNLYKGDLAIEKWKSDRIHIANYKIGSAKRIKVGSITVVDYLKV